MAVNGKKNNKKPKIIKLKINASWKNILLYGFLVLFMTFIFMGFNQQAFEQTKSVPISKVVSDVKQGKVSEIVIVDNKLTVREGTETIHAFKEPGSNVYQLFKDAGVSLEKTKVVVKDETGIGSWLVVISNILPIVLMVAFFYFIFRQARGAQENIFSFGRSRAKLFSKDTPRISFSDVAGVDEAKQELTEIVDFLKNPGKYKAVGARTPKGVLMVGPSGTGKCVTGDTIVWTNKGLMEIREIPRYYYVDSRSHEVYGAGLASFDKDEVLSCDKFASHWFDLGEQATIKVKLAQGFSLEGTPEHPVIVMTSDGALRFRKLEDIREGDYTAIQFGREMFGTLTMVDEDTAYLMGILTGDGNMSHASRVGLTNIDEEIIRFFKNYIKKHYPQSAITDRGQSYLVTSWNFKKYLYEMGMSYLLSFDKTVPQTILQSPKQVHIAFLQGLFDTDAYVEKNRAAFEYTTVSEKMARQVQMMLLNLGVVASLNIKGRKENGYYRTVYRIYISGSSFVAFGKNIGFRLSRKQRLVERHMVKMGRVNTNIDVIPGIGSIVERSWRVLSEKKLSKEKLSKTIDKVRRRDRISRQTLHDYIKYASALPVDVPYMEYLRSVLEANLFFSRVVEKSYDLKRVYDFTVPKTHSFLGNGFMNHNTLLARATAGEANVPFFSMAGSEFMEMLVGVGAARTRDLFDTAKKSQPAIIFIDEIDAIGRQRGFGIMAGHDEREQTLNQILVEMDGFSPSEQIVVMAATNRPDVLDPALIRPGRFDRRVILDMPDIVGRKAILAIHAKGKPFTKDVDWEKVAKRTVGFSGADLENMLNEAAILTARLGKQAIDMKDIEEAATKVKLGPEKRRLQTDADRKMTAYHEAGHALVSWHMPHMDPVHRISIVSRGLSLGHTMMEPTEHIHETKTRLLEQISVMLGGRAAESLVFKEMTTGASDDIAKATEVARTMVTEYGMSDLGPVNLDGERKRFYEQTNVSPDMAAKIDAEVKKITDTAYKIAASILIKLRSKLDLLAEELLKKETIEADSFVTLLGPKKALVPIKS
jgi:ATP-dependent metalloprotease FtsH